MDKNINKKQNGKYNRYSIITKRDNLQLQIKVKTELIFIFILILKKDHHYFDKKTTLYTGYSLSSNSSLRYN